jgi:ABC-2 type transport system permease protein
MLFDPQLVVFGPAAYVIYDYFGGPLFMVYGCVYPVLVGTLAAVAGFLLFRRRDVT